MAAAYWAGVTADVNYWALYRASNPENYIPKTAQQVQAFYRLNNYLPPAPQAGPAAPPQPRDLGDGQPLERPPARDTNIARRAFLDRALPQLQGDAAQRVHWRGIKFLGEGISSRVGLWEYTDPNPNAVVPGGRRQIAVKELKTSLPNPMAFDLAREAAILIKLRGSVSPHIAHMIHNPGPVSPDEKLPAGKFNDVVRRIFLEYCSLGSLNELLERRIRLAVPFTELTLWRIFDCLVDGISVLQYGNELVPDAITTEWLLPSQVFDVSIVHFDLKPANILLEDKRRIHPVHPLCKISDFGVAQNIRQPQSDNRDSQGWLNYYQGHKRSGTHGFYAPEQFTERWDHAGWDRLKQGTDLAGMYEATNTWGIGCIMYQLITMSLQPPDPSEPFLPQHNLGGNPPQGITYGTDLQVYPFSNQLLDLVQGCLYEMPHHRPSLDELKENTTWGIEATLSAGAEPEPWNDFMPAEPLPANVANSPPLPVLLLPAQPTAAQKLTLRRARIEARRRAAQDAKLQAQTAGQRAKSRIYMARCRHLFVNLRQCKSQFQTDGEQIYCTEHGG